MAIEQSGQLCVLQDSGSFFLSCLNKLNKKNIVCNEILSNEDELLNLKRYNDDDIRV